MSATLFPDHDFGNDPAPRPPWMTQALNSVGASEADILALSKLPAGGSDGGGGDGNTLARAFRFLMELRTDKGAKLAVFERFALEAAKRGWPIPIGAETLAGKARYDVKGFTVDNDLRPFYVLCVLQRNPSLVGKLELNSGEALALAATGWKESGESDGGES